MCCVYRRIIPKKLGESSFCRITVLWKRYPSTNLPKLQSRSIWVGSWRGGSIKPLSESQAFYVYTTWTASTMITMRNWCVASGRIGTAWKPRDAHWQRIIQLKRIAKKMVFYYVLPLANLEVVAINTRIHANNSMGRYTFLTVHFVISVEILIRFKFKKKCGAYRQPVCSFSRMGYHAVSHLDWLDPEFHGSIVDELHSEDASSD